MPGQVCPRPARLFLQLNHPAHHQSAITSITREELLVKILSHSPGQDGWSERPAGTVRPDRQYPQQHGRDNTHNMESSPILQAVRNTLNTDNSQVNNTISQDQISYLLTLMVTISVISILILIISVFTILGFIW